MKMSVEQFEESKQANKKSAKVGGKLKLQQSGIKLAKDRVETELTKALSG